MPIVLSPEAKKPTVREIVHAALRHLTMLAAGETASADDARLAFDALETLVDAWRIDAAMAEAVDNVPYVIDFDTELILPQGVRRVIEWTLARELCADFAVPPAVEARAERNAMRYRRVVIQKYTEVPELTNEQAVGLGDPLGGFLQ